MKSLLIFWSLLACGNLTAGQPGKVAVRLLADMPYKSGEALDDYERERCKMDARIPVGVKGFPTLVWFHGGALTRGDKDGRQDSGDRVKTAVIAESLAASGIAVFTPNYRLSPKVVFPDYVLDAASAVGAARDHAIRAGGDPVRIFIAGHSAGAYLALLLALDGQYLRSAGMSLDDIAGCIPVSGQTVMHSTIREERDLPKHAITIDETAPLHFISAKTRPLLLLYADDDMAARAEENALFVAMMKRARNPDVTGLMIRDRTHETIASLITRDDDPSRQALLDFMKVSKSR
jgi:acetyl esterase/lipase